MAEKSTTDYVLTGLSVAVTAAVAVAGYLLSLSADNAKKQADQFETANKQFAVISDFLRKCTSNDAADRRYVDFFVSKNYDLSMAHPALSKDQEFKTAFEKAKIACYNWLQASQTNSGLDVTGNLPKGVSTSAHPAAPPPVGSQVGNSLAYAKRWVYLGTYNNGWVTMYFSGLEKIDPKKYQLSREVQGPFTVKNDTGAVNVRSGTFVQGAAFPPVTTSLSPGQQVQIVRTWVWFNSDNWWAEIK